MNLAKRRQIDVAERFIRHVAPPDDRGCMIWTGSTVKWGRYGRMRISPERSGRGLALAHRVAYALAHGGRCPEGQDVHHECGVTLCCNPGHLRLVPHDQHGAQLGGTYWGPGRAIEIATDGGYTVASEVAQMLGLQPS